MKQELRNMISQKTKEILTIDYRNSHSFEICKTVLLSSEYQNADAIFAYMALPDEVDLSIVIAESFATGKKVAIPRVDDTNGNMTFCFITPETELEDGAFGVLEPPKPRNLLGGDSTGEVRFGERFLEKNSKERLNSKSMASKSHSDENSSFGEDVSEISAKDVQSLKIFALIPGRAFTEDGNRLGRGGGYYDKFLQKYGDKIIKFGVCFPFQVLDEIPMEENDCKVDRIICG